MPLSEENGKLALQRLIHKWGQASSSAMPKEYQRSKLLNIRLRGLTYGQIYVRGYLFKGSGKVFFEEAHHAKGTPWGHTLYNYPPQEE